ncbi:hypothetical protein F5890DRAFT_1602365 [Lentinula detonsa]|uniref:Uncharacterized protein n=1 Tax=Lentinula detonsa TaxID=2804962 RepID=A0AA38ULL4_9AGAR|nr:hypothetical protein F5890DRAFT_1602365 [Lentinula detonsa]
MLKRKASSSPDYTDSEQSTESDSPEGPPTTDSDQLSIPSTCSPSPLLSFFNDAPLFRDTMQLPLGAHQSQEEAELSELEFDDIVLVHEKSIEEEISSAPPMEMNEEDGEFLEDEMDENLAKPISEIKPWDKLWAQLKAEIKGHSKTLPVSKLNRLLILVNFANLRLKGESRMKASESIAKAWHDNRGRWFARRVRDLARYYQTFEHLPEERRGGTKMNKSWLHREDVRSRTLEYLNNLPTGKVTPQILCQHINNVLFPELGIVPKNPLSLRTARWWLIRLGWRWSLVKKGVYMDGHERSDVVLYCQTKFLPAMAEYEQRMTQYEWDPNTQELKRIEPHLQPGEYELIPQFHDESSFHHLDYQSRLWLKPTDQPLRKKGRGRLIHVSEFINPETGRLIYVDEDGKVIKEARKIIYPGAGHDAWWDTEQLLKQMDIAIEVFEHMPA